MHFSMTLQDRLYARRRGAVRREAWAEALCYDTAIDLADGILKGKGLVALDPLQSAYEANRVRAVEAKDEAEAMAWQGALDEIATLRAEFI